MGELQRYVDQSRRDGSLPGVLLIHLQRVVEFNTSFGYQVGDRLLAIVRDRIAKILRPHDTLQRIGDHDFVLVLPSPKNMGHASLTANRIVDILEAPFEIDGNAIKAQVAIDVSLFPGPGGRDQVESIRGPDQVAAEVAVVDAYRSPGRVAG